MTPSSQLREQTLSIWRAGIAAVRGDEIVRRHLHWDGDSLIIGEHAFRNVEQVVVFGAGKATMAMWRGLGQVLAQNPKCRVRGWINVPDLKESWSDEKFPMDWNFVVHRARPVGSNEPTVQAMEGTERIVEMLQSSNHNDLVIGLISGGGSALLPLPPEGVTLDDKLRTTRLLAASGCTIHEINAVRRCLSRSKAGGLARACSASRMVSLILSDVLDDSLETIASGPTDVEHPANPDLAWSVLSRIDPHRRIVPKSIWNYLAQKIQESSPNAIDPLDQRTHLQVSCSVKNVILGNNRTSVMAASQAARTMGMEVRSESHSESEGEAEAYARSLMPQLLPLFLLHGSKCWISGGETYVTLPFEEKRGIGGRNMHLALCLLKELATLDQPQMLRPFVFLSAGTDGEDGPTSAAGAWIDSELLAMYSHQPNELIRWIERCDSYHFFEQHDRLLFTGATQTNVCDLRVLCIH